MRTAKEIACEIRRTKWEDEDLDYCIEQANDWKSNTVTTLMTWNPLTQMTAL